MENSGVDTRRDGRNEGRAKHDVGGGDHDEASVRMGGVSEDCPLSMRESVSYTRNNEPHLKLWSSYTKENREICDV